MRLKLLVNFKAIESPEGLQNRQFMVLEVHFALKHGLKYAVFIFMTSF